MTLIYLGYQLKLSRGDVSQVFDRRTDNFSEDLNKSILARGGMVPPFIESIHYGGTEGFRKCRRSRHHGVMGCACMPSKCYDDISTSYAKYLLRLSPKKVYSIFSSHTMGDRKFISTVGPITDGEPYGGAQTAIYSPYLYLYRPGYQKDSEQKVISLNEIEVDDYRGFLLYSHEANRIPDVVAENVWGVIPAKDGYEFSILRSIGAREIFPNGRPVSPLPKSIHNVKQQPSIPSRIEKPILPLPPPPAPPPPNIPPPIFSRKVTKLRKPKENCSSCRKMHKQSKNSDAYYVCSICDKILCNEHMWGIFTPGIQMIKTTVCVACRKSSYSVND